MEFMSCVLRLRSDAAEQTQALGRALGACALPGNCLGLRGELGAGKTAFASGVGAGLGVEQPLRSPSYLLCCEHSGRAPVLHLDAYFEARMESLLHEGLAARFTRDAVVVIEWSDRLSAWWPADRLELSLCAGSAPEQRWLEFQALGPRSADWLGRAAGELLRLGIPAEQAEPPPRPRR